MGIWAHFCFKLVWCKDEDLKNKEKFSVPLCSFWPFLLQFSFPFFLCFYFPISSNNSCKHSLFIGSLYAWIGETVLKVDPFIPAKNVQRDRRDNFSCPEQVKKLLLQLLFLLPGISLSSPPGSVPYLKDLAQME